MHAPFAARLEFEMLHGIGDICLIPVQPGVVQHPVQQLSGRSNEGAAGNIFLISRLFTDNHQSRIGRSFARY